MGLYTGLYQGATMVRLCVLGHSVVNETLQSGRVIKEETNPAVIGKLNRLAHDEQLDMVIERPGGLDLVNGWEAMGSVYNGGDDMGR